MRVIAGKYKRKNIQAAKGMTSRPTTDKIKENIFNILGPCSGAGLDLFAGSGGLGIEALSRGMDKMIFVDGSEQAVRAIRDNLKDIEEETEVYRNDALRALKALSKRDIAFDLIFLDPPYDKKLLNEALERIQSFDLLAPGGRIVCECDRNEAVQSHYTKIKEEIYGSIKITIFER